MPGLLVLVSVLALQAALVGPAAAGRWQSDSATAAPCTEIAPRSVDEVVGLWYGDTTAAEATGEALPDHVGTEAELPAGDPVDAATAAAIEQAARAYVACVGANDLPRLFALATDRFVRASGPPAGVPVDVVRPLLEGGATGSPESTPEVLAVRDARRLADGRVGVVMDVREPDGSEATGFLVFVQADDRWLVDQSVQIG